MRSLRLLRPLILCAWRRHWPRQAESRRWSAPVAIFLFMCLLTWLSFDALRTIHTQFSIIPLPPFIFIAPLISAYAALFTASAMVHAVGALYVSGDLPILLASPTHLRTIFFAKLADVFVFSITMAGAIALPVGVGLGAFYNFSFELYAAATLGFILLSLICAGIAITVVVVCALLIPASQAREIFVLLLTFILLGGYALIKLPFSGVAAARSHTIFDTVSILFSPLMPWYWLAALLEPGATTSKCFIAMCALAGGAIASISLSYAIFNWSYELGLVKASNSRLRAHTPSTVLRRISNPLRSIIPQFVLAMLKKDMVMLLRDLAQAVQLFVILGICVIYLYNAQILSLLDADESIMRWWKSSLTVLTAIMSGLVVVALCARFVFPSLSLEGQSFWVLQTAPLSPRDLLQAKWLSWWPWITLISCVLFLSGGLAIDATPGMLGLLGILGIVLSYGLTGLATGLGAVYCNFDWEHPSQIAASFGNFIFIVSGFFWVVLIVVIFGAGVALDTLKESGILTSSFSLHLAQVSVGILCVGINLWITRFALAMGATHVAALTR